jgi:hypothetical protein
VERRAMSRSASHDYGLDAADLEDLLHVGVEELAGSGLHLRHFGPLVVKALTVRFPLRGFACVDVKLSLRNTDHVVFRDRLILAQKHVVRQEHSNAN